MYRPVCFLQSESFLLFRKNRGPIFLWEGIQPLLLHCNENDLLLFTFRPAVLFAASDKGATYFNVRSKWRITSLRYVWSINWHIARSLPSQLRVWGDAPRSWRKTDVTVETRHRDAMRCDRNRRATENPWGIATFFLEFKVSRCGCVRISLR